ncbi:DUF4924 family protein [Dysgonomonas sp. ZJ279]|uniref:DUF4924 family protein n=1 Tax=Dysgonomonas sp. ZJ279 TaxID=2709796 RepID=UPI0013ED894A|nr:DUF4924 family protein [Dysgonomonas sp. ZJ279]
MLIAKKLKQDNIAEYLLYMWQVEDLIRAYELDIDKIDEAIIEQYAQPEEIKAETKEWYEGLIDMMRREGITESGHLVINKNVILDLTDLHLQLLKSSKESDYTADYYKTLSFIVELRSKSPDKNIPELETCFSALYGFLLMKLQKKEVSGETQAAISQISSFLRLLSIKYKENRENGLEL